MRTKKILLSLLLMFGMILGFMPMTAVAAEADDAWTSYAASEFAGGSGTKEDPYRLKQLNSWQNLQVKLTVA